MRLLICSEEWLPIMYCIVTYLKKKDIIYENDYLILHL